MKRYLALLGCLLVFAVVGVRFADGPTQAAARSHRASSAAADAVEHGCLSVGSEHSSERPLAVRVETSNGVTLTFPRTKKPLRQGGGPHLVSLLVVPSPGPRVSSASEGDAFASYSLSLVTRQVRLQV